MTDDEILNAAWLASVTVVKVLRSPDMTDTSEQLLPCPFCGNDGSGPIEEALHVSHSQAEWRPSYDMYSAQCDKCAATTGYFDTEDEAVTAWNTRTPRQLDTEVVARVRGEIDPPPNLIGTPTEQYVTLRLSDVQAMLEALA